ncbi:MAG: hypothetical protein FGM46_04195, partial [Ferruginibacter sp.]|nr:hypothetical protein [Ferruginibacter sp.]
MKKQVKGIVAAALLLFSFSLGARAQQNVCYGATNKIYKVDYDPTLSTAESGDGASQGSSGSVYTWTISTGFAGTINGSTVSTLNGSQLNSITVDWGTTPSGTTYTITVKEERGGCSSTKTLTVTVNAIPSTPTITPTAPTCSSAGSSTISNYDAALTYMFTPAGPSVGTGGAITGMTVGTSYTVTASNTNCTSASSASFSNAAQLTTPSTPT